MNELIEWLTTSNASPDTVRSLLNDQGTDMTALHAAASERLAEMRTNVDSDATVTADSVRAVKTIIAASAPPADETATEPDADADGDTSDEPETGTAADTAEQTDSDSDGPSEETTDDGGGAVTLDNNQDNASVTEAAPAASVEGDVIPAEAFKASGKTVMTMNRPGVAARFSDAKATNAEYQAFAGSGDTELGTAGDVANHVNKQLDLLRNARGSSDPRGVSLVQYKAQTNALKFYRSADMRRRDVEELITAATSHHTQFASNGFCAPSVQHYEFCPVPTPWGMFGDALPIIVSERGGNEWPVTPSVGDLWGQGIECRTEQEEMERTEPKACTEIGCPGWVDYRDNICHICVVSSILQNRAFPEYTDQMVRTYELIYEMWINWMMLQKAIEYADEQNGELRWDTAGWGILQALKEKVGFAIDSIAARTLLNPWETTWNVAIPFWAYSAIQADAAKRVGADMTMLTLGREPIETILRGGRTVRFWPQMPWQTSIVEDVPDPAMRTWMGSDTSVESGVYPETMEILIWPQGAFVGVRDDFLDIRARWDYGLQRDNKQLEMFSETVWNVIPRCYEAMHITLDICTAGRSGNLFDFPCNTAPAPDAAALSVEEQETVRAMTAAVRRELAAS